MQTNGHTFTPLPHIYDMWALKIGAPISLVYPTLSPCTTDSLKIVFRHLMFKTPRIPLLFSTICLNKCSKKSAREAREVYLAIIQQNEGVPSAPFPELNSK